MSSLPRKPARWLANAAVRLTFASGIGYVAAAYSVSRWLTRRGRKKPGLPPAGPNLRSETLECHTADGIRLAGWLVEPPEPRATVVLFHGMRSSRLQMVERIGFLTEAGYRCVAFDHRAHGHSGGRRLSFGYLEGRDVTAIAGLVRESWPDQPRAALGVSMGAAALCFAERGCGWDALVLESLYADLNSTFSRRIGTAYPAWFGKLYPAVVWLTQKRLRVRIDRVRPVAAIGELGTSPVFLLTGGADAFATPEDMTRLAEVCAGPCESWLVPGAGHSDVYAKGGGEYRTRVLDFLNRHLSQA